MLLAMPAMLASGALADRPGMFCAEQTAFILKSNEKLKSVGIGIHIGTAHVATPRGVLIIRDGNHWPEPSSIKEDVILRSGVQVVRATSRGGIDRISYAIYGHLDESDWGGSISDKKRVVAWISGSALRGDERDDPILERFRTVPFEKSECTFFLDYGWDVILEEEAPPSSNETGSETTPE